MATLNELQKLSREIDDLVVAVEGAIGVIGDTMAYFRRTGLTTDNGELYDELNSARERLYSVWDR